MGLIPANFNSKPRKQKEEISPENHYPKETNESIFKLKTQNQNQMALIPIVIYLVYLWKGSRCKRFSLNNTSWEPWKGIYKTYLNPYQ